LITKTRFYLTCTTQLKNFNHEKRKTIASHL
jgi:hypothetical protein